jgi:hypothetical protein
MTTGEHLSWKSMARLTSVADVASAHVLAARLDHEGIDCQIRSEALGPYPIAVGSWGETEIWVASEDYEDAKTLLGELETEQRDAAVEPAGVGKSPDLVRSIGWWLVAAALLAWILYLRIGPLF